MYAKEDHMHTHTHIHARIDTLHTCTHRAVREGEMVTKLSGNSESLNREGHGHVHIHVHARIRTCIHTHTGPCARVGWYISGEISKAQGMVNHPTEKATVRHGSSTPSTRTFSRWMAHGTSILTWWLSQCRSSPGEGGSAAASTSCREGISDCCVYTCVCMRVLDVLVAYSMHIMCWSPCIEVAVGSVWRWLSGRVHIYPAEKECLIVVFGIILWRIMCMYVYPCVCMRVLDVLGAYHAHPVLISMHWGVYVGSRGMCIQACIFVCVYICIFVCVYIYIWGYWKRFI